MTPINGGVGLERCRLSCLGAYLHCSRSEAISGLEERFPSQRLQIRSTSSWSNTLLMLMASRFSKVTRQADDRDFACGCLEYVVFYKLDSEHALQTPLYNRV